MKIPPRVLKFVGLTFLMALLYLPLSYVAGWLLGDLLDPGFLAFLRSPVMVLAFGVGMAWAVWSTRDDAAEKPKRRK